MHSHLDTAAKTIAAWKDDQEGQVMNHEMHSIRRPWDHLGRWGLLSEFTGFGTQYVPHTQSLSSLDSVRVRRATISLSEIHEHPKTKNWGLSGMGLFLPLFHIGFLFVVAMCDPNGVPAVHPFGHRLCTGQREAFLSLRRHGKQKHKSTKKQHKKTRKVRACVTKPPLNNASFLRNYTESITRRERAEHGT